MVAPNQPDHLEKWRKLGRNAKLGENYLFEWLLIGQFWDETWVL